MTLNVPGQYRVRKEALRSFSFRSQQYHENVFPFDLLLHTIVSELAVMMSGRHTPSNLSV